MSSAAFYKWRAKYGGMDASMVAQMKELATENRRLKKMYAEKSMQNELLKEALGKKALRPSQRREMAKHAIEQHAVSIALACRTFGVSQTCYRYKRKLDDDNGADRRLARSLDEQPAELGVRPVLFVSACRVGNARGTMSKVMAGITNGFTGFIVSWS